MVHNTSVEFDKEPGRLQRGGSLTFEQTLKAAANVYIFSIVLQICINVVEIISKGNVTFSSFSIN